MDLLAGDGAGPVVSDADLEAGAGGFYEDLVEDPTVPEDPAAGSATPQDCLPDTICLYDDLGWKGRLLVLGCEADLDELPDLDTSKQVLTNIDPELGERATGNGRARSIINRCPSTIHLYSEPDQAGQKGTVWAGQWHWSLGGALDFDNYVQSIGIEAPIAPSEGGLTARPQFLGAFLPFLVPFIGELVITRAAAAVLSRVVATQLVSGVRAACLRAYTKCARIVKRVCQVKGLDICPAIKELACFASGGLFCLPGQKRSKYCPLSKLKSAPGVRLDASKDCTPGGPKKDLLTPTQLRRKLDTVRPPRIAGRLDDVTTRRGERLTNIQKHLLARPHQTRAARVTARSSTAFSTNAPVGLFFIREGQPTTSRREVTWRTV